MAILAVALVAVIGVPAVVSAVSPSFTGVPESDWANANIEWLSADGIARVCGGSSVTRREMAAFLHRLSGDRSETLVDRLDELAASCQG